MRRPWLKQDSTTLEVFEEGRTVKCGPAVALMLWNKGHQGGGGHRSGGQGTA